MNKLAHIRKTGEPTAVPHFWAWVPWKLKYVVVVTNSVNSMMFSTYNLSLIISSVCCMGVFVNNETTSRELNSSLFLIVPWDNSLVRSFECFVWCSDWPTLLISLPMLLKSYIPYCWYSAWLVWGGHLSCVPLLYSKSLGLSQRYSCMVAATVHQVASVLKKMADLSCRNCQQCFSSLCYKNYWLYYWSTSLADETLWSTNQMLLRFNQVLLAKATRIHDV